MASFAKLYTWAMVALVTISSLTAAPAHVKQQDTSFCTDASVVVPSGITQIVSKPNISNIFHTHVEAVIMNKNKTTYFSESFDSTKNQGFVSQTDYSLTMDIWYDYNINQLIGFYPQFPENAPGRCIVKDLSKDDARYLFGYEKVNGHPHIFSAAGALHFSGMGVNEKYMGTTTKRGIKVDWWRSCQYWQSMDATMFVDWYFSAQNYWDSAVGVRVPIMAHVKGRAYKGSVAHPFEHYYSFFGFEPYIRHRSEFETPAGVPCPGRKSTRTFPQVPKDAFSSTVETLDQTNSKISTVKETYYYAQKLVKFEYRPQKDDHSFYGTGSDLLEVHDFRTGIAYVTDKNLGNCSWHAIEPINFDDRLQPGTLTVRIANAKEFFYFDTQNITYGGVKTNRDIPCDTWVGFRTDYPFNNPENTTWDWYFAKKDVVELDGGKEVGQVPVQMRITYQQSQKYYQYNFYNFKKDKPDLLKFDISACYLLARRKFQFMIHASNTTLALISTNIGQFKYDVLQALMKATRLSPVRIARLQTFFTDSIIVSFEILDKAPKGGDIKRDPTYNEVTLDFAGNTVAQMVQNGQFAVSLDPNTFNNAPPLVAVPYITEVRYSQNQTVTEYHNGTLVQNEVDKQQGYGPGPMAAVGVTMPLLGAGLGVVFAYFFFK